METKEATFADLPLIRKMGQDFYDAMKIIHFEFHEESFAENLGNVMLQRCK